MRALIVSTGLLCSRLAPYTHAQTEAQRQHYTSARREHSSAARTHRHTVRETHRGTECAMSESWLAEANCTDTAQHEAQLAKANHIHNRTFVHCVNA